MKSSWVYDPSTGWIVDSDGNPVLNAVEADLSDERAYLIAAVHEMQAALRAAQAAMKGRAWAFVPGDDRPVQHMIFDALAKSEGKK